MTALGMDMNLHRNAWHAEARKGTEQQAMDYATKEETRAPGEFRIQYKMPMYDMRGFFRWKKKLVDHVWIWDWHMAMEDPDYIQDEDETGRETVEEDWLTECTEYL